MRQKLGSRYLGSRGAADLNFKSHDMGPPPEAAFQISNLAFVVAEKCLTKNVYP